MRITDREAAQIQREIEAFMERLGELGVTEAVILFACVNEQGHYMIDRRGCGNPFAQDGMMQSALNDDAAFKIGREVADQFPVVSDDDDEAPAA